MDQVQDMLLPASELNELARGQIEWIERCLATGDHDNWTPHVTVRVRTWEGEDHLQMYSLLTGFNTDAEKRSALLRVGATVYESRTVPVAAVLSSEAWLAPQTERHVQPKDHPDRREVIIVAAINANNSSCALSHMEVRRVDGLIQPGTFGELQSQGAGFPLLKYVFAGFVQAVFSQRN